MPGGAPGAGGEGGEGGDHPGVAAEGGMGAEDPVYEPPKTSKKGPRSPRLWSRPQG